MARPPGLPSNSCGTRRAATESGCEWVLQPGNSEEALRNGKVDLWPLLTITPERKRVLHISDPYMQHENCFLVRAGSRYLAGARPGRRRHQL